MSGFTLAVCAELVHTAMPVAERLNHLHSQGFAAEIWDWTAHDLDLLERCAGEGIRIESMTGYVRGDLHTRDGADELLATAAESVVVARRLGNAGPTTPRLNLHGTGLGAGGLPVQPIDEVGPAMWLAARETLARVAALGEREGVVFMLENLNRRLDHPGVPFATVPECLALIESVDSPALRLNLDLYHAQIDEGNLIETCERALPWVGEIQIADVPGRGEPGTGEINYAGVAAALRRLGYAGTVAFEGSPAGDSGVALDAFRAAFTA